MINKLAVLLIDDNREEAKLIRTLLAQARGTRFDLEEADSLLEAFEIAAQTKIDAILLALTLADSQGLGILLKLRAEIPETPVIVLASPDDELLAVAAMQEGAQD